MRSALASLVRESDRPARLRDHRRLLVWSLALITLGAAASAQQPLFTFIQTSDSQPQNSGEWQGFEDVLALIADAGTSGALLPRKPSFVLFAGDLTWGSQDAEFIQWKSLATSYLTANGIPLLCVPGNHDVSGGTANYEQHIGTAAVWDVGSAAFTAHNGLAVSTGWAGMRFIGFNNTNTAWNQISSSDISLISARVNAGAAASENVFLLGHHPHDGQSRIPLASILTNTSIVGYLHGHSGNPDVSHGLTGVNNPNVWDLNTNAIVDDRDLIYVDVFSNQLKAYVIELDLNPTQLPTPSTIPLVHALRSLDAGDVGFEGLSQAGARALPSSEAPEQKAWFNAGSWWAVLWSSSTSSYRIYRLDATNQTWIDTGTVVSTSSSRSFDALASGSNLYLASNQPSVPSQTSTSTGQVSRFHHDAGTNRYLLDAGFPVAVNGVRTETLTIARDTTGTLWAGWTHNATVFVSHSLGGNDASWSAPIALPFASATGLAAEDTCALVAFGGKLAVLWSNGPSGDLFCAVRNDGDGDGVWTLETAVGQASLVGDQIDLATSAGVLYALVRAGSGTISLATRSTGGAWSVREVAKASAGLFDPTLVVDETHSLLRVFATGATLDGMSQSGGGAIFQKTASLSGAFPLGKGTPFVQDGSTPALGRATSSHQAVTSATRLVVLASNASSSRYWHGYDTLATRPGTPVANFSGAPRTGVAPLSVQFTDQSSGPSGWAPTDWFWEFGDGQTSSEPNPVHVYASAGSYTVRLTASSGGGSNVLERAGYVVASQPLPGTTFTPVADTKVYESNPNTNYGSDTTLRAKTELGTTYQSFLRFDLSSMSGSVSSAKLRLFCTDDSPVGGTIYLVSNNWTESGTTWATRPALPQNSLASVGSIAVGSWAEFNVAPAISGPGILSFGLASTSTNSVLYSTREGTNPPQLVIELSGGAPAPVANFSGTPTSGVAPLSVAFTDLSTNAPTAWLWNFGDGGTSTLKNPTHVYSTAGNYTVTLQATNSAGSNTSTKTNYISVTSAPVAPVANFSGTPTSGVAPLSVAFTDLSTGAPTAWLWTFGDGGTSTLKNPTRVYAAAGTYTVTLQATNSVGSNTVTKTNYVSVTPTPVAPVANFSGTPTSGPGPLSVAFTDLSTNTPTSWLWTFGDGGTSTLRNPTRVYTAVGTYTVTLQATNSVGSNTVTKTNYVTVTAIAPVANFSGTPTFGLAPLSVAFTDLSTNAPTSWLWTFGDGGTSTLRNPTRVYAAAGTYTVTLQATNAAGTSTFTRTNYITAQVPPVANFTANPTTGPAPLSVAFTDQSTNSPTAWLWTFGDGTTSTSRNPTHVYANMGVYDVTLRATNAVGSGTITKPGFLNVLAPLPVTNVLASADARVERERTTTNFGSATDLRVRGTGNKAINSYLRFVVPTTLPGSVVSAKLRCFYSDGSDTAGQVFRTSSSWTESGITWSNKPAAIGGQIASGGTVGNGVWFEFDVTSAITGPGTYDFVMTGSGGNVAIFSSREGSQPPRLAITSTGP